MRSTANRVYDHNNLVRTPDFKDRLGATSAAKKAQIERARANAEDPAANRANSESWSATLPSPLDRYDGLVTRFASAASDPHHKVEKLGRGLSSTRNRASG